MGQLGSLGPIIVVVKVPVGLGPKASQTGQVSIQQGISAFNAGESTRPV